jgi:hypothetical protein
MTQPYQPQYQPYAPQQPLQSAFAAPPQYGYPVPAPQPAPQFGGQMPPTAAPKLGESSRTGGGPAFPRERHYVGRTVIIEPVGIDEDRMVKNDDGVMEKRPMATFHLTVVDGGPMQYGDNQSRNPKEAHGFTMETDTPARFVSVTSDRFGLVNEVRDTIARGDAASVGVLMQGTRGRFPFLMTKCSRDLDGNDRPDGGERFERATLVWNQIFGKTFQNPEPRSLVAAPSSAPPQVQYQPQVQPAYAGPQQGYAPMPPSAGPGYGQNPYGQPAPQQPTYQQAVAAHPGTGPYGDGYNPAVIAPQVQQMPQPAPMTVQPNPAFEAWLATLPPEQQATQRAALAGQPAQPTQPAGPGF